MRSARFRLDYSPAEIGGREYFMPRRSEVQVCDLRGFCDKKLIEFTLYRKFSAESQIVP